VTDASFPERAVVFGRSQHLVGVLSTPPAGAGAPPPGILFINSGIIHRVGANRIYVRLARALAGRGAATLRFDLSGIGDSSQPSDQLEVSRAELEQRDIDDALALMRREGIGPLIVAGLCSGADNSLAAIARDERVSGAVLLDPFAFRTLGYLLTYYGPRILQPAVWWRAITGQSPLLRTVMRAAWSKMMPRRAGGAPAVPADLSASKAPSRDVFEARLRALLARNARMLWVFTGGLEARYNYRDQFFDAFPRLNLRAYVDFEYIAQADHTFSREVFQQQLEARIVTWYDATFGAVVVP